MVVVMMVMMMMMMMMTVVVIVGVMVTAVGVRPSGGKARLYRLLLVVLVGLWGPVLVDSQCHKNCHGHGSCSIEGKCTCYQDYTGPDCSLKNCPYGLAWCV